jgi:hypothetical protein
VPKTGVALCGAEHGRRVRAGRVRARLLPLAPRAVRQGGESMLALEGQLEAGDPSVAMKLRDRGLVCVLAREEFEGRGDRPGAATARALLDALAGR